MLEEIESAANFLTRLIAKSNNSSLLITQESIDSFSRKLCQLLEEKFRDHWFPEKPIKGQAYRCIRINENNRRDPIVEKACNECGIRYDELKLPLELTLWVDPNEVTCRFGEHKGSYCIVAKFRDGRQENYIDQINIDELEQKSIERAKQASFELLNSRKKRQQMNNRKNGYNLNAYSNGFNDYSGVIPTTCSPSSSYYSFYGNGTPFATQYGTSPPQNSNVFTKYPISPPQSRSLGNTPYRGLSNKSSYNTPNGTITGKGNNNNNNNNGFSRGLQSAFNSATFGTTFSYQQNDRYHWVSKSIVKA
jgi:hypothetical protein